MGIKKIVLQLLKAMYIFPVKKNKIFLTSFSGNAFGFDSKAFFEYINENYPSEYEIYWGSKDTKKIKDVNSQDLKFVKLKSLSGIYHMMTAGIYMNNINPPSYIPFRNNQILINTWHGFAYKKVGKYTDDYDKKRFNCSTCFISHSKFYTEKVLKDSFEFEGDILECGAPRNDIFFSTQKKQLAQLTKRKLNIEDKSVALFAPTFRGNFSYDESDLDFEKLIETLHNKFGNEWVILCRLHPMIAQNYRVNSEIALDVSGYQDMQELLNISDVLITDYSSSMWDFGLLKRPVFIYATDIEKYIDERGFYYPAERWPFPIAHNNGEMENIILNFDSDKYICGLNQYYTDMGSYENGQATKCVVDYIRSKE